MPIQEVGKDDASQLNLIADILASSKKVIVVTGAGISTNCGIPVSQACACMRYHRLMAHVGLRIFAQRMDFIA